MPKIELTSLQLQTERDPILTLFLNSITDQAVFCVSPEGTILTWNEGCVRLKGFTSAEAIGRNFKMLYTEAEQESGRPATNLQLALDLGRYHEEGPRIRKGGGLFIAEVSIYPIFESGHLMGFAKIVKDVSERRKLEEERDALDERLEKTNKDLQALCFAIAHDFRAPIRGIVFRCTLLQEEHSGEFGPAVSAEISRILDLLFQLASLVDDLLSYMRIGRGDIVREEIDLSQLVNEVAEELAPTCHDGDWKILIQDGMIARADPILLTIVIRNLIQNSCKYSDCGVKVRFKVEKLNSETVYSVADNGIGIDMQFASRLFKPFQRLHANDKFGGTGMGLAIVENIVTRHGGRIWLESEPGAGSTFFFTLGEAASPNDPRKEPASVPEQK